MQSYDVWFTQTGISNTWHKNIVLYFRGIKCFEIMTKVQKKEVLFFMWVPISSFFLYSTDFHGIVATHFE